MDSYEEARIELPLQIPHSDRCQEITSLGGDAHIVVLRFEVDGRSDGDEDDPPAFPNVQTIDGWTGREMVGLVAGECGSSRTQAISGAADGPIETLR